MYLDVLESVFCLHDDDDPLQWVFDRHGVSIADNAAQLDDRLHPGHRRLDPRVDPRLGRRGEWQEVDGTKVQRLRPATQGENGEWEGMRGENEN